MKLRHYFARLFRSRQPGVTTPLRNRTPSRRPTLEELEPRIVLAVDTELGTLVGRQLLIGSLSQSSADTYSFALADAASLDVQVTNTSGLLQHPTTIFTQVDGPAGSSFASDGDDAPADEPPTLHIPVPPGTSSWDATVNADAPLLGARYRLVLAADEAPGRLFASSVPDVYDFRGDVGRDLGTLSTVGTQAVRDFIGYLDTDALPAVDRIDTYFFDIPAFGTVSMTLDQLENDPAGGEVFPNLTLLRDVNGDGHLTATFSNGHFQAGDVIDDQVATVGQSGVVSRPLNAGHYAVIVSQLFSILGGAPLDPKTGGSNYRLRLSYSVADNAGNTLTTARDVGGLSTFADYLSAGDPTDIYELFVTGGGPFILNAGLSNMPTSANFDVDILQEINGNVNVLATGNNPFGNESISADTTTTGTYYVRVRQVKGEGPYTLSVSVRDTDAAGNALATATNLGNLFGRTHLADFVSATDRLDIYKFTLTDPGTVTASFPDTAANTDADLDLIQDANGNGVVDDVNEILDSSITIKTNAGESVSRAVAAGTYYVRVLQRAGSPAYHLTLGVDTAGNTPASARGMSLAGDAASTIEFVGPGDAADFYKVSIGTPLQLNVFFSLFSEPFAVVVGQDANGNGMIDRGEALLTRTITKADDARQTVNMPSKGVYLVEVSPGGTLGANYGIVFATAPTDNAGDTPAAARNVGVLGAERTFNDFVGDGSIDTTARGDPVLGADDVDDFYRFTLGNNGPYDFPGRLSNLTGNADIELIRDDNQNQKVDGDDTVLASSTATGTTDDLIDLKKLATPGIYYLHVFRSGGGTTGSANYTLTMSAASTDTAGNSLLTAKNEGLLTSSSPLSDGEFVGAIDLDDFYSFTVPGPGILTVARSSVAGIGLEVIQDANFNFMIDPGETLATSGGAQTFGGPTKLGASLPAAGIYYVHVLTNGINANYTLSLGFANTVGTFVLSPREAAVTAGDRSTLALEWTVPDGASWHTLQDVQIRLRNRLGTLVLIDFREADKTVRLYDPASGNFGPAKAVGSDAVLADQYVNIFLRTSTVAAAGPASPTVTLTVDIEYKDALSGLSITIEATATDDLGQVQDFAFAGTLSVAHKRKRP